MYFGFVIRHVARKVLVATTVVAAASLVTRAGRLCGGGAPVAYGSLRPVTARLKPAPNGAQPGNSRIMIGPVFGEEVTFLHRYPDKTHTHLPLAYPKTKNTHR